MSAYGIHWFRRDLRLVGNPALDRHLVLHPGRVLGVFCFDRSFLARPDFSAHRFAFFLRTLEKLREEMRERGGDLLFLDVGPEEAFPKLLEALARSKLGLPKSISWNRDYEPYARTRDSRMHELFERRFSLEVVTERDHLLIEPNELVKDERATGPSFYQVFTPFKKKWLAQFASPDFQDRMRQAEAGLRLAGTTPSGPKFSMRWPEKSTGFPFGGAGLLESYAEKTERALPTELRNSLPLPGHAAARALLEDFRENWLSDYAVKRDIPSLLATSKMSVYLKNGSITVAQIVAVLKLGPNSPHLKYFEELIWREFYYHILFHVPRVETEAFNPKYRSLAWQNDRALFDRWREGHTGFPIVDAGMRQLAATGWMHNRVRMIVASFLTKDLLVDYRWGERHFMEKLLDGDLAPNNGGWQWAASTGCDPQPYFRVFNPTSQGEKFDPRGDYLARWAPEYLGRKSVHEALNPIVDHGKQRERALTLFKSAR
jgi:deoxyribodipyrimidine photo-lyase